MAHNFTSVDEYIGSFPPSVAAKPTKVRGTIHGVIREAGEAISYRIPTITP